LGAAGEGTGEKDSINSWIYGNFRMLHSNSFYGERINTPFTLLYFWGTTHWVL
jgi:hypothetical protein